MSERKKIALLNDSFPPTIDGVANVVKNYAEILNSDFADTVVATPWYPNVKDNYDFPVIRYPSFSTSSNIGYRAGTPFSPDLIYELEQFKPDIIHCHCPIVSAVLARMLRERTGAPIIFTYHTKFDIDIKKAIKGKLLQEASIRTIVNNISACDDVWVVSRGAGENLKSLGYTGNYTVMENGVDFPLGTADPAVVNEIYREYSLSEDTPLFLYVGRMMWYKGVKLSLDGLAAAKAAGKIFKFILIGDGADKEDIAKYADNIGLSDDCIFTGALHDREKLRGFFTIADLFLFPSTFDTNGIVVREAAACSCPSLLLKGSCAAEGIIHNETGIIIDESMDAMKNAVIWACNNRHYLKNIGKSAAENIYISWNDAVAAANTRYDEILKHKLGGKRVGRFDVQSDFLASAAAALSMFGNMHDGINKLSASASEHERQISDAINTAGTEIQRRIGDYIDFFDWLDSHRDQ